MTSVSVFAWVRLNQILPSVSSAAIKEIRGATYLSVNVPAASVGAQILRRKRVWFNQDSSTLMIRRLFSSNGNICSAYCYRSTRHLSLFDWIATILASR